MDTLTRFTKKWKQDENGCWIWHAAVVGVRPGRREGYGHFWFAETRQLAHRVAYQLFRGPIPAGMVIDHLCRNTLCVNPDHLEVVTAGENTRRGWPAQKTHCIHGHPFDEANTYWRPRGGRGCRTCTSDAQARYQERKKVAA